eukprot:scaffold69559_cov54-Phaeocystis_antarctica.AAC.5
MPVGFRRSEERRRPLPGRRPGWPLCASLSVGKHVGFRRNEGHRRRRLPVRRPGCPLCAPHLSAYFRRSERHLSRS